MKDPITTPGKTYAVTSPNGCTVTQHVGEATIVHDVPAGVQVLIIAQAARMEVSDDSAVVTECGGSAELVFTAATTRAASSGSGSDGMTAEERALLNGAAQRDADNTFTAGNTFTGAVDMSGAQVTPPVGWNVGELTPEAIQQVVPIAWSAYDTAPQLINAYSIALGGNAFANAQSTAIGFDSSARNEAVALGYSATGQHNAVSLGFNSKSGMQSVNIGGQANSANISHAVNIGKIATTKGYYAVTIGAAFSDTAGSYTCTTEGTGSITIGAGANTLNNGATESSNSVTIGCKAENKGADSVVIGATATTAGSGNVIIGAAATSGEDTWIKESVAIGKGATVKGVRSVAIRGSANGNATVAICGSAAGSGSVVIGGVSKSAAGNSIAIGNYDTITNAPYTVAIGNGAKAANHGAVVFRSTASDGTYTQFYFSGANTPLANTYENGEAMMGYVVRDSAGNIMTDVEGNAMVGTQKLSVLFPNNRGENAFTPAMLSMDEDWTPKPIFHPSDLDMPQEEPTEPEEYTPLPVYPIVEPEIPEMEEV